MNSLSWLLIFIDWVGNAKLFFSGLGIFSFIFMIIWIFLAHLTAAVNNDGLHYSWNKEKSRINHLDRFNQYKKYLWIPIFIGLVDIIIPSTRTMYLVAASEIGDRVISNEKVMGLVDPTIDILKNYITLENEKIQKELKDSREPIKK